MLTHLRNASQFKKSSTRGILRDTREDGIGVDDFEGRRFKRGAETRLHLSRTCHRASHRDRYLCIFRRYRLRLTCRGCTSATSPGTNVPNRIQNRARATARSPACRVASGLYKSQTKFLCYTESFASA